MFAIFLICNELVGRDFAGEGLKRISVEVVKPIGTWKKFKHICIVGDSETVVDGGVDFDTNARNFGYFGEGQDIGKRGRIVVRSEWDKFEVSNLIVGFAPSISIYFDVVITLLDG